MELNVYERLQISKFLPEKATLDKAIVVADIKDKTKLTQEIVKKINMRPDGGQGVIWDGDDVANIAWTGLELQLLKDGVASLAKKEEVDCERRFIDLCTKLKNGEVEKETPIAEEAKTEA